MTDTSTPFIFLPGSGGVSPHLSVLKSGPADKTCFETIGYPGWKRYIRAGFSPQILIEELAAQVEKKVPVGPIRIMGHSIGGHFGYTVALLLQAKGRDIAGFCAIDSFMVTTAAPTAGWQGRALKEAIALLKKGRVAEFVRFTSSRFWRTLIRMAGGRVSTLVSLLSSTRWSASLMALNPTLERELSMRLLVQTVAPWLPSLDHNPVALKAPCALIRTPKTAGGDQIWLARCPDLQIYEIGGNHHTLFDPENAAPLRDAFLDASLKWNSNPETKAA